MKPSNLRGAVKIGWLAATLTAWASWDAAAQIKAGDSIMSLGLGAGIPITGLNLSRFGGGSEAPGTAGVSVSPRYLYQINPSLGLGAELGYMDFPDKNVPGPGSGFTVGGSLLTVEAVARYLALPQRRFSPYLIGGLGLSEFSAHVRRAFDSDTLVDTTAAGLALSLGGGVQGSITSSLLAIGELRWRFATTDSGSFGTGTANALGFLLGLGWKF